MSWDASFDGDSWNYTHNTNEMVAAAMTDAGLGEPPPIQDPFFAPVIRNSWWKRLDGMSGREGAEFVGAIIRALEADPAKFREMNPANGWGSYDGILAVLRKMKAHSDGACCDVRKWHTNG